MILKISQLKKLRHRRTLVVLLIFSTVIIYVLILVQEHFDEKKRPTLLEGKNFYLLTPTLVVDLREDHKP